MSVVVKKTISLKIDGKDVTAEEGTVILEAAKQNGFEVTNLCYNRKLKPFAACRTCMVETVADGVKELVYSCTQPVAEGMAVRTNTEETNRYNKACLEMLLVEHPLDCPICDKSGVCPLQDNTDALKLYNGRFEINRRNEPSIKTNPIIEFYLNRCIMCGLCVRACDETQGVQALDFHKRGMKVGVGTANDEPLDCEFCGQCITVCPTGALMDMTSEARGLAAMFTDVHTTCSYCSWGCTFRLQTKKGKVLRIEGDEGYGVGVNEGNLCAKGRFGHGVIHNEDRIKSPLMNQGGEFKEIGWDEAIQTIAERMQATVNRSGPGSIAGIGSEKMTNEESYLFQKLFRNHFGSNQITNLANLRAPYVNQFMLDCFKGGIKSQPVTELERADVVLIFNSDIPSEYPVGGNSIRKGAVFTGTDIIIANPRNVVFNNEAQVDMRLTFTHGADIAVINRLIRIIIDENLIDLNKAKAAIPNYNDLVKSLKPFNARNAKKMTGLPDEVLTQAAKRFARKADRFIIIGNDILDSGQGEDVLKALLNLSLLVHYGGEGNISVYPPREHCNSQGANDMGVTPQFLPGYQSANDPAALEAFSKEWGREPLKPAAENPVEDLFTNCSNGKIKLLYVASEDPMHSYYQAALVKDALQAVPFLVVQDIFMTETAKMADIILPTSTFAEKDGTYTNMTRHVQRVAAAALPQGMSKPDFDIFCEITDFLGGQPQDTVEEVQKEIERTVSFYKGMTPGTDSRQWPASGFAAKPEFQICRAYENAPPREGFPYRLQTSNHMFHIGGYTRHAKALVDVGPDCFAELHPEDAESLGLREGDRIVVESENGKLEVPFKTSYVTAPGMVYIPQNWIEVPVHHLRNGEEGLVPIKVSKAG